MSPSNTAISATCTAHQHTSHRLSTTMTMIDFIYTRAAKRPDIAEQSCVNAVVKQFNVMQYKK